MCVVRFTLWFASRGAAGAGGIQHLAFDPFYGEEFESYFECETNLEIVISNAFLKKDQLW